MARQSQVQRHSVYECVAPFTVWPTGIPDTYAAGRKVDADDPILRTHGQAFAPVTATTVTPVEQATAAPGEYRPVTIPAPIPQSQPVIEAQVPAIENQIKEADHG